MSKFNWALLIILLFLLSLCILKIDLGEIVSFIFNLRLSDLVQLILGTLFALLLVVLTDLIKTPQVEFSLIDPIYKPYNVAQDNGIITQVNRKFLKIRITIKKDWRNWFLLSKVTKNIHSVSKLMVTLNEERVHQIKWDTAPEPIDYSKPEEGTKYELIPFAFQLENLVEGDIAEASIAVKHDGEGGYYIFDPYYYTNEFRNNTICNYKKKTISITFKSALRTISKNYIIINPDTSLDKFALKEV